MSYIDGFVLAIPTANRQKFIDHAMLGDSVFLELGATRILECWGDDVPDGKLTDFRRAVQATAEETVVFSWIEWPDKPTRDRAMERMMGDLPRTDDRLNPDKNPMPFDGARMIYGGFQPVVTLEREAADRPGDYIWYELLTTDADAAEAFYASVLGWTYADSGMADVDYRIVHAGEHAIGGVMPINTEMAAGGAVPGWLGYIAVADVDASVAAIEGRGGAVRMPAMDLPGVGRIALVADPAGAPFYVMTPATGGRSLAFAYDVPRVGHCAWNELQTPDQGEAWTFYGDMFGWTKDGEIPMGELGSYDFIRHGSVIGAIMRGDAAWGPPRWTQYFRVADIDAAHAAIERGGGTVARGPDEIPGGEYSINAVDPQGASFGIVGPRHGGAGS